MLCSHITSVSLLLLTVGLAQVASSQVKTERLELQPLQVSAGRTISDALLGSRQNPRNELAVFSRPDATLNSIAVVSEDRLCAVGNCGSILITVNAGRTWQPRTINTTANLHDVAFDGQVGYAVGGWIGNYSGSSRGTVLRTTDGGDTWEEIPVPSLCRLLGVSLVAGQLTAWGDYSSELKSSLFFSGDGGATWQAVSTGLGHLTAAAATGAGEILCVDKLGNMFASTSSLPSSQGTLPVIARPEAPLHAVARTPTGWLACGSNGEVIFSPHGQHWSNLPLPISTAAQRLCTWRAIAQVESQIWIVGSPGSKLLVSNDAGKTWETRSTGQSLDIHDLCFVDRYRGWAVGAQGTILATRDGGNQWYKQSTTPSRVGLMTVSDRVEQVPWCPMVAAAWDEKVAVTAVVGQAAEPIEQAGELPDSLTQLSAITPQIGISNFENVRLPDADEVYATELLAMQLLRWRPDVLLVTERETSISGTSATAILNRAARLAANSDLDFPAAAELGLTAWEVQKISTVTSQTPQYSEQAKRILRSTGISLWDALLHLPPDHHSREQSVGMQTQWSLSQSKASYSQLLGGIAPAKETQRGVPDGSIGSFQMVMGRATRENSLLQLVDPTSNQMSPEVWQQQLQFLLETFPEHEIAPSLFLASSKLVEYGELDRYLKVLELLRDTQLKSDVATWADLQLLRCRSSDEFQNWAKSVSSKQLGQVAFATAFPTQGLNASAAWNSSPFDTSASPQSQVVAASAKQLQPAEGSSESPTSWFSDFDKAMARHPQFRHRPDVMLMTAYQMRKNSSQDSQLQILRELSAFRNLIAFQQAARQELSVTSGNTKGLKWVAHANHASQPPVLDGVLDEDFWEDSVPMQLDSLTTNGPTATQVRWGFDAEYIYVGLHCPGESRSTLASHRTYDANLRGTDHVILSLDTDRDYNTTIELSVAADGQTHDRCCGHSAFNPKWHVFVRPETNHWTAEVAIRIADLTGDPNLAGKVWAVSARRENPVGPTQSWSQLRTNLPLKAAAGLLIFADEAYPTKSLSQ